MVKLKRLVALANIGQAWRHWYSDAREYIWSVCEREGWDMDEFVNVLAVLSPRISVSRNWDLTVAYFRNGKVLPSWSGVVQSVRTSLATYEATGHIKGRKTSAFARALHGDSTALVLDTWMAKALDVPHAKVTQVGNMRRAKQRMTRLCKLLDCTMVEGQAMVWAGTAITHGIRPGNLETAALRTSQMDLEF